MTMLETERLTLRNFSVSDWEALHEMINQYVSSEFAAYDYHWPTSPEEIKKVTEWFASGDSCLWGRKLSGSRHIPWRRT